MIARIGHKHPPVQGQDADQVSLLQAVVPMIVIGDGGGDVPGWLIQALVAFLGVACFACLSILLDLRPECLVGGAHLAGDIAGHLSRKLMDTAYLIVAIALQGSPTAHLAMRETVVAHIVQGIAVRSWVRRNAANCAESVCSFSLAVMSCFIVHVYYLSHSMSSW